MTSFCCSTTAALVSRKLQPSSSTLQPHARFLAQKLCIQQVEAAAATAAGSRHTQGCMQACDILHNSTPAFAK
jgi:hypothetical protein